MDRRVGLIVVVSVLLFGNNAAEAALARQLLQTQTGVYCCTVEDNKCYLSDDYTGTGNYCGGAVLCTYDTSVCKEYCQLYEQQLQQCAPLSLSSIPALPSHFNSEPRESNLIERVF